MREELTLVIELMSRGQGVVIDRRRITHQLQQIGLAVVEIKIVLGSLQALIAVNRDSQAPERVRLVHTVHADAKLAAEG